LLDAGFIFGAADLVRKERERAMAAQTEADLRAIDRLTEEMRARLSGEQLARFDEWVAESYVAPQDRERARSELYRVGLVLVAVAVLLVVGAFVLPHGLAVAIGVALFVWVWLLPIYAADRFGKARGRRDQWIWGILFGWVGVLVVLLRPKKHPPPAQLERPHEARV
jgi:Flp pilus assembly protein TadB